MEIGVGEAWVSEEENLQLFGISNKLGEGRDLVIWLGMPFVVFGLFARACFERVLVDGVPIEEKVLDRAVIMGQDLDQLLDLAIGQSIVRKSTRLLRGRKNSLQSLYRRLHIQRQLNNFQTVTIEPVLIKLQHIHFLLAVACTISWLFKRRMTLDFEHPNQRIHVLKEFPCRLVRFHVNLISFDCFVFLEVPDRSRHLPLVI